MNDVQAKTKPQESAIKQTAACSSSPNLIILCFFCNKNSSPNATNFIFKHSLKSSLSLLVASAFSLFLSLSCPLLQQPLLFLYLIPQALHNVYITQQKKIIKTNLFILKSKNPLIKLINMDKIKQSYQ